MKLTEIFCQAENGNGKMFQILDAGAFRTFTNTNNLTVYTHSSSKTLEYPESSVHGS